MAHLSDAKIAAYVHRQFSPAVGAAVKAHSADCRRCATAVRWWTKEDGDAAELLRALDHPVPRIDGRALFSTVAVRRPPRFSALAAGIALACAAAAAAAAVPNSPVRHWLESLIGTARSGEQQAAVSPPAEPERQKAKGAGGISIVPVHELEITFLGNQESGEIRVAFRDDERVSLQSTEAGPAYAIQKDRIVVNNAGSTASYEIGLPRALSTARISIASNIVFRSEAGTVSSEARPDREGRYIIPLMSRLRRAP